MYGNGVFTLAQIPAYVYFVVVIRPGVSGSGALADKCAVDVKLIMIVGAYFKRSALKTVKRKAFSEKYRLVLKLLGMLGNIRSFDLLMEKIDYLRIFKRRMTNKFRLHNGISLRKKMFFKLGA
jgi:hypothetical protein